MPLVAAERPIRGIVMINAVVPTPNKLFREAFDFNEVFGYRVTGADRRARPGHVRNLFARGTAER